MADSGSHLLSGRGWGEGGGVGKTACLRKFCHKDSYGVEKSARSCCPGPIYAGPCLAHPGQTDLSRKRGDDSGLVTCGQALLSVHQSMMTMLA